MPRRAMAQSCECGCGDWTNGGHFRPGHDATLRGSLLRAMREQGGFVRAAWMSSSDATDELNRRNWLPTQHGTAARQTRVARASRTASQDNWITERARRMASAERRERIGSSVEMTDGPVDAVISELTEAPAERTFGVEMEFFGTTPERVVEEFTARGLACHFEGYNHVTRSHWKIVTDVSVNAAGTSATSRNGRGSGLELVSPILSGADGFEALRLACEAMEAAGAKVDRTCGVHVHHGIADLDAMSVARVCANYTYGQTFIDALLPPSRRRSNYAMPRPASQVADLLRIAGRARMTRATMAYEGSSRYYATNLESISRHGTLEFRQHSGSTEFTKIANWVRLGQAIIAKSREDIVIGAADMTTWLQQIGCDADLTGALVNRAFAIQTAVERRANRTLVGSGAR
jgi:hypothetical protein